MLVKVQRLGKFKRDAHERTISVMCKILNRNILFLDLSSLYQYKLKYMDKTNFSLEEIKSDCSELELKILEMYLNRKK